MHCRRAFTLTFRRHHCRNCGDLVCMKCSPKTAVVHHVNPTKPKRICQKNCAYLSDYERARTISGVLYGDPSVGIKSLLSRIIFNSFRVTSNLDPYLKKGSILIANEQKKACINFNYTINQDISMASNPDCFFLVFDITNQNSFNSMMELLSKKLLISEMGNKSTMLLGNKEDLEDQRQVHVAKDLMENITYAEVSAKDSHNVDTAFITHILDTISYKFTSLQDQMTIGEMSEWKIIRKFTTNDEEGGKEGGKKHNSIALKKKNTYKETFSKSKKNKPVKYYTLRRRKRRRKKT